MDPISVVLADHDVERRIEMKKMLFQNQDIEVAEETENDDQTLSVVRDQRPELLIMNFPLGDREDIEDLVEEIAVDVPQTEIILIAEGMEASESGRKLLRKGARECLVRPIEQNELLSLIQDVVSVARRRQQKLQEIVTGQAPGRSERDGRIISVFSTKGGVGRSLVSCNLACMLRKLTQKRVALVDLDLQFGDDAMMLDMTPTTMIASLARDVKDQEQVDYDLLERYMHTHEESGIDLLAAPPRPEEADYVEDTDTRKILNALKEHYHYIVVDTSSQVTDPVIAAMELSDLIILLLTLDLPTIKDGNLMLELMEDLGLPRENVHIVMNRYMPDAEIQLQEVEEALEQEVLGGLASEGNLIMPSVNEGRPIVLSHPESQFSVQLEELTRNIVGNLLDLEDELVDVTQEAAGPPAPVDFDIGGLGPRFLAGLVDHVIMYFGFGIFALVGLVLGIVEPFPQAGLVGVAVGALGLLIPLIYPTYFHADGQTLGKQFMGLRVVVPGSDAVGIGTSFIRTLVGMFGMSFLGLGYLWILIDQHNRGLHDLAAGTYVVATTEE